MTPPFTCLVRVALGLPFLVACADPPLAPDAAARDGARPASAAISGTDVTVHPLPVFAGFDGRTTAVSEAGFVYGYSRTLTSSQSQAVVWAPPFDTAPVVLTPDGATQSSYIGVQGTVNDDGHATGEVAGVGGVWRKHETEAHWELVPSDMGGFGYWGMRGINGAMHHVAMVRTTTGTTIAAFWRGLGLAPELLPAPTLPADGTLTALIPHEINDADVVVGYVTYTQPVSKRQVASVTRAVVWTEADGAWTAHLLPGNAGATASDVNGAGWITGNANGAALLWRPSGGGDGTDGAYDAPVVVSASQGMTSQIDRCGRVIGYTTGSSRKPWVWEDGTLTYLPLPPGASEGEAYDVATPAAGAGTIVGAARPKGKGALAPLRWTIPEC